MRQDLQQDNQPAHDPEVITSKYKSLWGPAAVAAGALAAGVLASFVGGSR